MRLYRLITSLAFCLPVIRADVPFISGFTLTWSDDFVGTAGSLPNTGNWIFDTGTSYPGGEANWGTGEIQNYTTSIDNIRLDGNGNLLITALKDGSGQWTSARIESQRCDFMAQAGGKMRIQASLNLPKVPSAAGYWPAFWTLGSAFRGSYLNWPSIGEFDIMENVNGVNRVWGTLHCGTNPGGPCAETNGLGGSYAGCPGSACQGNFHTYTFEVDRTDANSEALRWFVDGVLFWQIVSTTIDAAVWEQAVHNPHFMLMNLAIGGAFPNALYGGIMPLASTTSGGVFQADYVAVYHSM